MSRAPAVLPALVATVGACLVAAACSGPEAAENRGPKVVRTTEGDVTTVDNLWGSAWDGRARLEEESVIGVLEGDEPYMLGRVLGVAATEAQTFVLDGSVPVVRAYDAAGNHQYDIGTQGQGPGEYEQPSGLALDAQNRLLVTDSSNDVLVYSTTGEHLETWSYGTGKVVHMPPDVLPRAGGAWVPDFVLNDPTNFNDFDLGYREVGPEGGGAILLRPEPETSIEPATVALGEGKTWQVPGLIPFAPDNRGAMAPDGTWYVGDGREYRFVAHHPDGARIEIRRHWEPAPVSAAEKADTIERAETMTSARFELDWKYNGPPVPDTKAAYLDILAGLNGERVWLAREGPSSRTRGCDPAQALELNETCWRADTVWDVFAAVGEYLGELTPPAGALLRWASLGQTVVVVPSIDEDGLVRVHRLRLVIPPTGT